MPDPAPHTVAAPQGESADSADVTTAVIREALRRSRGRMSPHQLLKRSQTRLPRYDQAHLVPLATRVATRRAVAEAHDTDFGTLLPMHAGDRFACLDDSKRLAHWLTGWQVHIRPLAYLSATASRRLQLVQMLSCLPITGELNRATIAALRNPEGRADPVGLGLQESLRRSREQAARIDAYRAEQWRYGAVHVGFGRVECYQLTGRRVAAAQDSGLWQPASPMAEPVPGSILVYSVDRLNNGTDPQRWHELVYLGTCRDESGLAHAFDVTTTPARMVRAIVRRKVGQRWCSAHGLLGWILPSHQPSLF